MQTTLRSTGNIQHHASELLLGNNIEAYENTIPSLLSDRLRNPKFAGPEHHQTGLAPEWEPCGNNMPGYICKLVPGMFLSGAESQLVRNFMESGDCEIIQTGVCFHAGEELEVEIWARAMHRPVQLTLGIRESYANGKWYDMQKVTVDRAHWHRYTARLRCPVEDANGTFSIFISPDSAILLDQVHLRPVDEPLVSQAFLAAFAQLLCTVLRFPGGCVSCSYHWESGIGPAHLRPVQDDPTFKWKVHYDFGTDEYLELCSARGMRPFITLNTTSATAAAAAAWAGYVRQWYVDRALPVPEAYFMLGNENDCMHEQGHMTGEMYVTQLRDFSPALRRAYPEARLIAIGRFEESFPLRAGHGTTWRPRLLAEVPELFDLFAVGYYATVYQRSPLREIAAEILTHLRAMETMILEAAKSMRDGGKSPAINIYEWNLWCTATHNDRRGFFEPMDMRHCLFAAGVMGMLCRQADVVEVANHYSLVNTMGTLRVHNGRAECTDIVKVFQLYADALPGAVLEVQQLDAEDTLQVTIIERDNHVYAFLINWHCDEAATVHLEEYGPIQQATGLRAVEIESPVEIFTLEFTDHSVTVPPLTIVRVEM